MSGLGLPELLVVVGIIVLLFGPTVIAFVLGYYLGTHKESQQNTQATLPDRPTPDTTEEKPRDE